MSLEKEIFDAIVERMELAEVIAELPPEKLAYDTPLFESMFATGGLWFPASHSGTCSLFRNN